MSAELIALISAAGSGLVLFARWAVSLWATVRRETIEADKAAATRREAFESQAAAAQRADNARMVDALLEAAKANAQLAGKIDQLSGKLDTLVEWRERTPIEIAIPRDPPSERRRTAAYAAARPSTKTGTGDD